MNRTDALEAYKKSLSLTHSKVTIKNYVSDVNNFIDWAERENNIQFSQDLFRKPLIDSYYSTLLSKDEASSYSFTSVKRHLSSLRSFALFLEKIQFITVSPFIHTQAEEVKSPWKIDGFKLYLYKKGSSNLTIKYYINDIQSFSKWCSQVAGELPQKNGIPDITESILDEYVLRLKSNLDLAPTSINRKMSSIRNYLEFLKQESRLYEEVVPELEEKQKNPTVSINELVIPETKQKDFSKIPPFRLTQKLLQPYFALENAASELLSSEAAKFNIARIARSTKNAVKENGIDNLIRSLSSKTISKEFYAPHKLSIAAFPIHKRIVFHIRHTRPVWYRKYHSYPFVHYLHFAILVIAAVGTSIYLYENTLGKASAQDGLSQHATMSRTFAFRGKLLDKNNKPITESSHLRLALYDTPTSSGSALLWQEVQQVKPSTTGEVNIIIGSNTQIPDNFFNTNIPLFLGVTVNNEEELSPRKQIGVPFAEDANNISGYIPNTLSDKQTNVLLALDSTGNLSMGGESSPTFQATGGDFTLSGQTLVLQTNASSNGNVVINPNGNGRIDLQKPLISTGHSVEIEGGVSISSTDSARPVIFINQENGAPLITANTLGTTRFSVDSQGAITKGIWAGNPIGTEFGGFGESITATGPGELLYSTSSTSYGHLSPGIVGQCLTTTGRSAPVWSSCGLYKELDGVITLTNNTLDLLLGDSSTSSAKFAFTNMNTSNPMFKIGNNISIQSNGSISTNNTDLTLGGGSTKNIAILTSNGNVGIQKNNPTRSLDVSGNWGGNVDYYTDGANTQTVTRDARALVYDLEKNTGTTNTSTTTTYNIVGLPDNDGTFAYIYSKVSKDTTSSSQSQTITININNSSVATLSTVPGTLPSSVIKHFTVVRSNNTWHLIGDPGSSDTADLAEWINASNPLPEPGSVVSFNENGNVEKSKSAYDAKVAGVISTNPHIIIGPQTTHSVRLALSGRIPVMVTSIGGSILSGDAISSSPIEGFGMRPARTTAVLGKAIQAFNPGQKICKEEDSLSDIVWPYDDGTNPHDPCFKVKSSHLPNNVQDELAQKYGISAADYIYVGKVMAFASLSWSSSNDILTSVENIQIHDDGIELDQDLSEKIDQIRNVDPTITVGKKTVDNIGVFSQTVSGKVKTAVLSANTVITKGLVADSAQIASLSAKTVNVAGSLNIQGKPLQQFISEAIQNVVSPIIPTERLSTNIISPLAGNSVAVELQNASDSALLINNKDTGKNVAKIDASGNISAEGSISSRTASISGALSSSTLATAGNADIGGTLRAGSIIAEDIRGLDEKIASAAGSFLSQVKPVENAPSSSFDKDNVLEKTNISAQFGTFSEGLLSLGASTFGNLSVMDRLSIGTTLFISQNAINTLATDLELQPLRQAGISFLAGLIKIQSDGQLIANEDATFNKNITVGGKIYTNLISPLPNKDIAVELPESGTNSAHFAVQNASSSAVLTINKVGDVVASGSGTFSKLNLSGIIGKALASNENEAVATGSAGTAILKANKTELTILNKLVSDHSLIYITPAQNTYNQVLFLMRQIPNVSFTVGVSQPITKDIEFNWLIVN